MRSSSFLPVVALAALTTLSCSAPTPPTLTVKSSKVTRVDVSGIGVDVTVTALSTNKSALNVQKVTGKIVLDGRYDLGTVNAPNAVSLPPSTPVDVNAP